MIVNRLRPRLSAGQLAVVATVIAALGAVPASAAPRLPEIRTSPANPVPRCVTPERLMAFLKTRNGNLLPAFRNIAGFYKQHGEAWGVRWDYAFFQMAIETNFLTYRQPNGRMGDVDPKQNNFAGIGTTGGGVPGDSFPDVSTGVLGQIQHLVVYSGEQVARPVAPRTQLKQEHILAKSRELDRPVRFSDLARRWAADPKYASSIEWVAERYRAEHCRGGASDRPKQEIEVLPWQNERPRNGGGRADAAGSPVRTVSSRDQKPVAAPVKPVASPVKAVAERKLEQAGAAPADAKTLAQTTVKTIDVGPVARPAPSEDTAPAVSAPDRGPAETVVAAESVATSDEPEVGFALFVAPTRLAEATMPAAAPPAPVSDPLPETRASDAGPVVEPVIAGPPPPPPGDAAVAPQRLAAASTASKQNFLPPSGLGVKPGRCAVEAATFGGDTTVLLKTGADDDVRYVALSVLEGFEDSMTKSFLEARPGGGTALGTFPSKDAALEKARALCPN